MTEFEALKVETQRSSLTTTLEVNDELETPNFNYEE